MARSSPASARRWSGRACRLEVVHARLLHSFRTGNRRGLRGALADARLVAQPWDFSVADVTTEVELLHGADDPVVPPAHAHWYAAHLPRARLQMVPGELHLSMCFRSTGRIQEACQELRTAPAVPPRAQPLRSGVKAV